MCYFLDSGGRSSRPRKGQSERPSTANGKLMNNRNKGPESENNSRSSSLYGAGRRFLPGLPGSSVRPRGKLSIFWQLICLKN